MSWKFRPVTDTGLFAHPKHGYPGGFLAGSLDRMRLPLGAQILDPILFVCSGGVRRYPYYGLGPNDKLVDCKRSLQVWDAKKKRKVTYRLQPDYVMDVRHELPQCPDDPLGWRAMIVDTPWSEEEARAYGTEDKYPAPGPLLRRCLEHVRPGGRVGFLHWDLPAPPEVIDGCKIHFSFAMPSALFGTKWKGYAVFEKRLPDTWNKRRGKK